MMPRHGLPRGSPIRAGRRDRLRRVALLAALLILTQPGIALAQDFVRGLSAYYGRHYELARAIWEPLAFAGDARSQSGLGFLYLNALGGDYDLELAVYWYRRAAEQGEPEAEATLGGFYVDGRGVERDLVQALKFCELALWHGAPRGRRCREEAIRQMSVEQVREAWLQFNHWVETHSYRLLD